MRKRQRRAEDDSVEEHPQLAECFQSSSEGVLIIRKRNDDFNVVYANTAAKSYTCNIILEEKWRASDELSIDIFSTF